MSDATKIEDYLRALSRALRALPDRDRDDIAAEIRAHLEHRAGEGKLADAMKALGNPDACARSFIEEMKIQSAFADGGPARTVGALLALASRRATAAVGLFASAFFFLIAIGFALTAIAEVTMPDKAGLWIGPDAGSFVIGTVDAPPVPAAPGAPEPPREVLGRWLIPVALAFAVLFFIIGQWLARFFVRLMAKRKSPFAL